MCGVGREVSAEGADADTAMVLVEGFSSSRPGSNGVGMYLAMVGRDACEETSWVMGLLYREASVLMLMTRPSRDVLS